MAYSKEEREKNKAILIATLNYLVEFHSQAMVFDDYSPAKEWYLQELKQATRDIIKSRSAQIERRLRMHTLMFREKYDRGINTYIKEKTGYVIDVFEQYKTDILPIVAKGRITDNDVYLVEKYLKAYAAVPEEQHRVALLKALQAKREAYHTELFSGDDLITESYYDIVQGKKSWTVKAEDHEGFNKELHKDWLLYEEVAPHGVDQLRVQFSGKGEHALTYINIALPGGEGSICTIRGEKLPIKAYWKDKATIVVASKSTYTYMSKYHQVSSYGQVVKVEYVELA